MRLWSALWGHLLNALFPPVCASCKREGDFMCADCLASLAKRRIVARGRRRSPPEFRYLDGLVYALDYEKNPQIKAAIKQFKYRFTEELAWPFARLLDEKLSELGMVRDRSITLIPIPLHPSRFRERGFNQAEVVAKTLQQVSHHAIAIGPLLERVKATSQQAKLSRDGRHENLKEAFIMNKKFIQYFSLHAQAGPQFSWGERNKGEEKLIKRSERKKSCASDPLYFLVDDVCTTGATLENAAKVLKEAGVPKVYGLVIARAFASGRSGA